MTRIWHKQYDAGIPLEINPNEFSSINDVLETAFRKFSDRPAFHNMGTTLTYQEIDQLSLKFASYLQNELKLQKGDRVAMVIDNSPYFYYIDQALQKLGMVNISIYPTLTAEETAFVLTDSGSKVLFTGNHFLLKIFLACGVETSYRPETTLTPYGVSSKRIPCK